MKVLIIGYKGMLGKDLMKSFNNDKIHLIGVGKDDIDITDIDSTFKCILCYKPDVVINSAAYTNVDDCEAEVELAYKVNALGPRNIAVACNEINASIVQISTDYIFDGQTNVSYREDENFFNPLSTYGKSKLEGEMNVKNISNKYYIVRTQWLFGKNGPNFVKTIINIAKQTKEIKVVSDQFGSPTYTKDLASSIFELIEKPIYGVYHLTNCGIVSWYEFACEILKIYKLNDVKVVPCKTEQFIRLACRPKYSPLENFYSKLNNLKPLRSYKEALQEYLEEENFV